ncbi:MAG TPA: TonB-dependent receptor, partial [Steroidobacteraceae bacterium]|nr:TonB-dependent receptor [Steroidobacteraceae bacterium]
MFKFKRLLISGLCVAGLSAPALADNFNIPGGELENALSAYVSQTGVHLIVSEDAIKGVHSRGAKGDLSPNEALFRILDGSGFVVRNESGVIAVVREGRSGKATNDRAPMDIAATSAPAATVAALETVTVTSSKIGGDVQNIPISITALSQEQLTNRQVAGGPDLIKEVPNLTFSKTNFTGYNIQIRGIGTQAISVTTDPAVAVAFNDMPFIRNHFFEQEFYDVGQLEVLRGPQGTLYGRNATAGVVNIVSAKPSDQFEAMVSADFGNYQNRRFEGMMNVPIIDERLDFRAAGEWTKRNGYSFNAITDEPIDGRDLWSGRATISFKPSDKFKAYVVWERFSEDDDRMRSAKQLCKTAPIPDNVLGVPVPAGGGGYASTTDVGGYFTQGCLATSLYAPDAFEVPNGFGLPYVAAGEYGFELDPNVDPYASTTQSRNLRVIESAINPVYKAKNDVVELNGDYNLA